MRRLPFALIACLPCLAAAPLPSAAAPNDFPEINIHATCHRGSVGEQSAQDACMKDEQGARTELAKVWGGFPGDVRRSCADEVHIGGVPSYVELLTCAQMHQWSREGTGREGRAGIPPVKP